MSIQSFLDISTAHLSPAARAWLSKMATANHAVMYHGVGPGAAISTLGATRCGWFMHAPNLAGAAAIAADIPEGLHPLIRHAHEWGVHYILFDADADRLKGLPTYGDED